jgi:3-phenylpropionate/trans-cinnamate dioxygenase ferredoxin reductase subunit
VSSDKGAPYDRTMLSKTFGVKKEGITLRGDEFLKEYDINLITNAKVDKIDTKKNFIQTTDGKHLHYEKVLIATGASPITPRIPNVKSDGVFTVRTFEDI